MPSRFSSSQRGTGPGLVVLLVIDQFPQWAFEQKLPELRAGGFQRLLSEGRWKIGTYPSAATLTAPGHALLGTGETSARSGILANEWWHRDSARMLKSVEAENGEISTKWLRVPGLGDAVAAAGKGGKAVSISLKDRAAVLPLGHSGTAIWYSGKTVDWVSNSAPSWLQDWNRSHPIALHLHDVWLPLDADRLRRITGRRDYQVGEVGDNGHGVTFPHDIAATKRPVEAIVATPLGNQLVLDTALAAIAGEHLGDDDVPDLLVVSLSAYDYIAHGWGHESWEVWDAALRLDEQLKEFLAALDRQVGAQRWAMLVTSDHGGGPLPELVGAGRLRYDQIKQLCEAAASTVLGEGEWIADPKFPTIYLSEAARQRPTAQVKAVVDAIARALRDSPGIASAAPTAELAGNCGARSGLAQVICNSLDLERSGEVFYMPRRGWILQSDDEPMAASHGTFYDYDQQVPVIELPFGRTIHAPRSAPEPGGMTMTAVAPLIATWLGVASPQQLPRETRTQ